MVDLDSSFKHFGRGWRQGHDMRVLDVTLRCPVASWLSRMRSRGRGRWHCVRLCGEDYSVALVMVRSTLAKAYGGEVRVITLCGFRKGRRRTFTYNLESGTCKRYLFKLVPGKSPRSRRLTTPNEPHVEGIKTLRKRSWSLT